MLTLQAGGVNLDDPSSSRPGSSNISRPRPSFAEVFNHLLTTRRTSRGRPYTLTEISEGTGLSVPYLSNVRKGNIAAVPFERVVKLARFFGVPLEYFSSEELPLPDVPSADASPPVSSTIDEPVLLRSGALGPEERAIVAQAIEEAKMELAEVIAEKLAEIKARLGLEDSDTDPGGKTAPEERRGTEREGV